MAVIDLLVFGPLLHTPDALERGLAAQREATLALAERRTCQRRMPRADRTPRCSLHGVCAVEFLASQPRQQ